MDRYSACQYASIRAHGGQRWERLARAGYRLFPTPQVTFLLAVDPAEAYRRIERRGTDHETMGWLTAADTAYRALPEYPSFVVVDAGSPGRGGDPGRSQAHLADLAAGSAPRPAARGRRPGGRLRPGRRPGRWRRWSAPTRSEARKRITAAISAGETQRRWSASGWAARLAGVSITLGSTVLHRTPRDRYSTATALAKASTAALAVT